MVNMMVEAMASEWLLVIGWLNCYFSV